MKNRKKKKAAKLDKAAFGYIEKVSLEHVLGLPIPEGSKCNISLFPDRVTIERNGTAYNLELFKITDAVIKTETEIQNNYVSSVGGAMGGMMLFGPLGAVIGGRAKKKTDKVIHSYMIFSYTKEDTIDFISFDCTGEPKANKIVEYFDRQPHQKSEVTL